MRMMEGDCEKRKSRRDDDARGRNAREIMP